MSFTEGQKVYIKPGTFHNPWDSEGLEATFLSYMAGREYAILLVKNPDYYNVRIRVEDLINDN